MKLKKDEDDEDLSVFFTIRDEDLFGNLFQMKIIKMMNILKKEDEYTENGDSTKTKRRRK